MRSLKAVLATGVLVAVTAIPTTALADGVRGCDSPTDRSCCSVIEALKGCRN